MRSAHLVGTNGDVISLNLEAFDSYTVNGHIGGAGFIPQEVSTVAGAADGDSLRNTRTPARDIDIPIGMFGTDEDEINSLMRRLSLALRWRRGRPMPRFVVTIGSEAYFLEVVLVTPSNVDADFYPDSSSWLFTFRAPQPHWQAVDPVNLPVYGQETVDPLLPELLPDVSLASASVLGVVEIDNPGTEDAPVVWILTGPFTSCVVAVDGRGFTVGAVEAGEVITVDTRKPKRVTDATGANRWPLLSPAPKLFHLPPGRSMVTLSAEDATEDTRVTGFFYPRISTVH